MKEDKVWTSDLPHLAPGQAASSLAFFAFSLPASPSSFTSASSPCLRLFTLHNPIHSEPGGLLQPASQPTQPEIRVRPLCARSPLDPGPA